MSEIDVRFPAELGLAMLPHKDRNAVLQAVQTAARTRLGRQAPGVYHYVDIRTDLRLVRAYYSREGDEARLTLWYLDLHYLSPQ